MENSTFRLIRYSNELQNEWDKLVATATNSTLLHYRGFMDYHRHRFSDYSFLLYKKNRLIAVFPACQIDNNLISHEGLTYGGVVFHKEFSTQDVLIFFNLLIAECKKQKFKRIIYKQIPYIYDVNSSEIDTYPLFKLGFQMIGCSLSSCTLLNKGHSLTLEKERSLKKAISKNLIIKKSDDWEEFWKILTTNLSQRYNKQPIHSLAEILQLRHTFPESILLYGTYSDNQMLAGTVLFNSKNVVHIQYIASTFEGKQSGAVDLLVNTLINSNKWEQTYFDYGISTENDGNFLNNGLLHHKEGFGLKPLTYKKFQLIL